MTTANIDISEEVDSNVSTATVIDPDAVRKKIILAKTEDKAKLVERDVPIDLVWNSMVSKQHGVLAGSGGIAKSMTIDTACEHIVLSAAQQALRARVLFKVMLRKTMPIEEIIGPLSLKGLENDEFRYILDGGAADSHLVFLDEIFKANAVVLNALLMLINERVIINDRKPVDLSKVLWAVFGASNELPNEPELHAFRDRFAWVYEVKPVATDDGFKTVLRGALDRTAGPPAPTTKVSVEEMEVAQHGAANVTVPDDILNSIATMKRRAEGEFNLFISARRYIAGIRLCQAQAWLNGRSVLIEDDLTLFQHTLWTDLEDSKKAYEVTLDYAGKVARVTQQLRAAFEPHHNDLAKLKSEIPTDGSGITQELAGRVAAVQMNLKSTKNQVDKQIEEARTDNRDTSELEALANEIASDQHYIRNDILG